MLSSLSIKNYTLIENLNIDLSGGFSVITGETGAGKSMLLGALGLVLGKRADLSSLKNEEEKCVIEAVFSVEKYGLKTFFEEQDLDFENETIIRREILPSGKSRAFVNDSPVTLQQLDELGNQLMDIHSQHQTRELSEEKYQFEVLDILAENEDLLTEYSQKLSQYKKNKKALEQAQTKLSESLKEQEYNLFVFNELNDANLKENEQEELETQYEKLNNTEVIKEVLSKTLNLSDNEISGILQNLNEIKLDFSKISGLSEDYKELWERINSVQIEFSDILQEVNNLSESVFDDPSATQRIGDRLQLLYDLQKKHKVNSVEELIGIKNNLEEKVVSVDELSAVIEKSQKLITQNQTELDTIARQLHQNREKAITVFDQKITILLAELGMNNARFDIKLIPTEDYFSNGKDKLEFLFSANKGGNFGLLKKTASGGELSRIMLATKAILAEYKAMPTIIFDEIDTGVSGEIALKMAQIMQQMSKNRQVISITHLPQIASKGNNHYKVYKSVTELDTVSDLKLLSNQERIEEIAEMLSGKNPTESALQHAKTLLN
ncbi:MAG: DNA repair protein RecN [Flavobacteriaceae bacterium]